MTTSKTEKSRLQNCESGEDSIVWSPYSLSITKDSSLRTPPLRSFQKLESSKVDNLSRPVIELMSASLRELQRDYFWCAKFYGVNNGSGKSSSPREEIESVLVTQS